jgi:hypothetical protein
MSRRSTRRNRPAVLKPATVCSGVHRTTLPVDCSNRQECHLAPLFIRVSSRETILAPPMPSSAHGAYDQYFRGVVTKHVTKTNATLAQRPCSHQSSPALGVSQRSSLPEVHPANHVASDGLAGLASGDTFPPAAQKHANIMCNRGGFAGATEVMRPDHSGIWTAC